jgi:hypothetical protein
MRTRRRATIEDLRVAIDCLPRRTRLAMLQGIEGNAIIVGAYTSPDGICPMLAAHRAGGRTSLIAFAEAWDRVAFRDARRARARRATERELLILRAHLEASLLEDEAPVSELAAARREHVQLQEQRRARAHGDSPGIPGDPDRTAELQDRPGWAWTRIFRRYDEYERVLRAIEDAAPPAAAGTERRHQPTGR